MSPARADNAYVILDPLLAVDSEWGTGRSAVILADAGPAALALGCELDLADFGAVSWNVASRRRTSAGSTRPCPHDELLDARVLPDELLLPDLRVSSVVPVPRYGN